MNESLFHPMQVMTYVPSGRYVTVTIPNGTTPDDLNDVVKTLRNLQMQAKGKLVIFGDPTPRPRRVCLCGSTRFYEAFQKANYNLTMQGKIVLTVGFYPHSSEQAHGESIGCDDDQKRRLDELHLRKIDIADEVLVLDVQAIVCGECGKPSRLFTVASNETECCRTKLWSLRPYIGDSTRREIAYAHAIGKPVHYLSGDDDRAGIDVDDL